MRVKVIDLLGNGMTVIPGSFVVLETDLGDVFMIASEIGQDGTLECAKLGDPTFVEICQRHGIRKLPIIEDVKLSAPPAGAKLFKGPF